MEDVCTEYIAANPPLQQHLLSRIARAEQCALLAQTAPSWYSAESGVAGQNSSLVLAPPNHLQGHTACTSTPGVTSGGELSFLPPPSPGYPPLPHQHQCRPSPLQPSSSSSPFLEGALTGRPPRLQPLVLQVSLRLDAFDVLQRSPVMGEVLLCGAPAEAQASFSRAVVHWVEQRCIEERGDGLTQSAPQHLAAPQETQRGNSLKNRTRKEPSPTCPAHDDAVRESLLQWSRLLRCAFADHVVQLTVDLLLLRVPHFFSAIVCGVRGIDTVVPVPPERRQRCNDRGRAGARTLVSPSGTTAQSPRVSSPLPSRHTLQSDCHGGRCGAAFETLSGSVDSAILSELSAIQAASSGGGREEASPPGDLQSLSEIDGWPLDTFLEEARSVRVVGVVFEVFFRTRRDRLPAPWIVLLPLPLWERGTQRQQQQQQQPQHSHFFAVRPSSCLTVDLRSVREDASYHRGMVVVGQVIEVRGKLLVTAQGVSLSAQPAGGGIAASASSLARAMHTTEYLQARSVRPLFTADTHTSLCQEMTPESDVASEGINATAAPTSSLREEAGGGISPLPTTVQCPTAAVPIPCSHVEHSALAAPAGPPPSAGVHRLVGDEQRAADLAVRCWCGLRLALGMADAPPPCRDGEAVCTGLFSLSFDVLLATMLVVVSAQLGEADAVSALLLDEGSESFLSPALSRLAEAAPTALTVLHSGLVPRLRRSFFLPRYVASRGLVMRRSCGAVGADEGDTTGPRSRVRSGATLKRRTAPTTVQAAAAVTTTPSESRVWSCVPPLCEEVIRAGALSVAHHRALVVQRAEGLSADVAAFVQDVLRVHTSGTSQRLTASASCAALGSQPPSSSTATPSSAPLPATPVTVSEQVIRREGGQAVPYLATHALLCTLRDGAALLRKPAVFELAQRVDLVVRPSVHTRHRLQALCGATEEGFQSLLQDRGRLWLGVLRHALLLPFAPVKDASQFRLDVCSPTASVCSPPPPVWSMKTPTLSQACAGLLRSYFLTAKALGGSAADNTLMESLVKLTCCHALLRLRLCHVMGCPGTASLGHDAPTDTTTTVEEEVAAPFTALIDAVVAVGLCDSSLHFLTGTTLLGRCVLSLFEDDLSRAEEVDEEAPRDDTVNHTEDNADEDGDEDRRHARFVATLDRSTRLPTHWQSERGGDSRHPWSPAGCDGAEEALLSIDINELVDDLMQHLNDGLQRGSRE